MTVNGTLHSQRKSRLAVAGFGFMIHFPLQTESKKHFWLQSEVTVAELSCKSHNKTHCNPFIHNALYQLGPQGPQQKTISTCETKDLGENSIKNDAPRDATHREQQNSLEIQHIVDAIMTLPGNQQQVLCEQLKTHIFQHPKPTTL